MRVIASPARINRWLNPYNWLLNTHLQREGVEVLGAAPWRVLRRQGDVWHVHWPDHVFNQRSATRAALGSRAFLHLASMGRRHGIRLVWTVHNLRAHDGRHAELERAFWAEFLPAVDGLIHLSEAGREAARAQFPGLSDVPTWVIPHGHYRTEYVTDLSRTQARQRLAIDPDAPLVLFTGRIRPYKNVSALLRAFATLPDRDARCLITGASASPELTQELQLLAGRDARVRLELRHLRRAELAIALRAADLVVLPYREILNSGSALLALSLNTPVLVPRRGALAELADVVGSEWVRCFDGELTGDSLRSALEWARETPRPAVAPLDAFEWPAIARAHGEAYATLVRGVRRSGVLPDDHWPPTLLPAHAAPVQAQSCTR